MPASALAAPPQIESSMAVQSLKPRIDMMKARYGDDKNKIQRETQILYEQAGVNPLAGRCPAGAGCDLSKAANQWQWGCSRPRLNGSSGDAAANRRGPHQVMACGHPV